MTSGKLSTSRVASRLPASARMCRGTSTKDASILTSQHLDMIIETIGKDGSILGENRRHDILCHMNESIFYWIDKVATPRRPTSTLAPHIRPYRFSRRKRRLKLLRELHLYYEILGGHPSHCGWKRDEIGRDGFAKFLEIIYGVLPPNSRPPTVETFVRDAEHLGFNSDPRLDARGGCVARAEYILRTITAWRRKG